MPYQMNDLHKQDKSKYPVCASFGIYKAEPLDYFILII